MATPHRPATPVAPLLDWHAAAHFDHRSDRPCVLCGRPTPLRHGREPVHKVCAETWQAANPNQIRFVSDTQARRRASR